MQMEISFTERLKFYYKNFFTHYFNLSGRARRSEFWFIHLFNLIIGSVGFLLVLPGVIWNLAIIIPLITLTVRRFHDRGHSGWLLLIYYALTSLLFFVILGAFGNILEAQGHSPGGVGAFFICLICILVVSLIFLVVYCLPSQKGENRYGFNPIEMEDILNHFNMIEAIFVGSSPLRQMGSSSLFGLVVELEQSKSLFKQIYTAKKRLNRMMLLNSTIERIERTRHEVTLQPENPKILLEQLEQLENQLRALPSPLFGS